MTHSNDIYTLARWMAADFSNQQQAYDNPPFYAHIRVCMRPLPWEFLGGLSLYLEQAYDIALDLPYRARVLGFVVVDDHIEVENYEIAGQEAFYGASREPDRLQALTPAQLTKLPCCNFHVTWTGHSFQAVIEPGKRCMVTRKERETYLDSSFEVFADRMDSLDRGRDPQTDELIWGSIAGAFHFEKRTSFAEEVPSR